MTTLSEQLRNAATVRVAAGEPQSYVARQCGLSPSLLSRFIAGKGGLSWEAADRLAAYLGVGLVSAGQSRS
jgi:transcriptional regulator with XRE-family HTH domain